MGGKTQVSSGEQIFWLEPLIQHPEFSWWQRLPAHVMFSQQLLTRASMFPPRSPALTCLHLSASKFSDVPSSSSGGIASFLCSDASSSQSLPASAQTQPSPGAVRSLFEKAAEKRRVEEACQDEDASRSTPVKNASGQCGSRKATGISSFFQRKSLEKNVRLADSDGNGPVAEDESGRAPSESSSSEDLQVCERCGQKVPVWEMPEHTDYHFALDLQKSFSSSASVPAAAPQTSRGKRAKTPSGPQPKRARVQGNTLDSFFKKTWCSSAVLSSTLLPAF